MQWRGWYHLMRLTANQKRVLNKLLDKYEGSKSYQGINQVNQNYYVRPVEVWKEYQWDYTDVAHVKDFEMEIQCLENDKFVSLEWKSGEIIRIKGNSEMFPKIYGILQRKQKSELLSDQEKFFQWWIDNGVGVIVPFSKDQIIRIQDCKKPEYDLKTSKIIFDILQYIQMNNKEILERELSVKVLGDSKAFQQNYRRRICKLLMKYKDCSKLLLGVDEEREQEKILLEEYNIFANPSYVYMKGKAVLEFNDGSRIKVEEEPFAVSALLLKKLAKIIIDAPSIMTIENLSSFHREKNSEMFYLYLAGYHNSAKQLLLKKIFLDNLGKQWLHFGDIDPDGFYILENLKRGTKIDFLPYRMGIDELQKYKTQCKELVQNDRIKAEHLINDSLYMDILQYMLDHNCKLEQEIVSFSNVLDNS